MNVGNTKLTFWEHLDILRTVIIRIITVWFVLSIVAFIFKSQIFSIILAPKQSEFITYQILHKLCNFLDVDSPSTFDIHLINTGLAQQFVIHMKTALCVGFIFTAPFALYHVFTFISPGLYSKERNYVARLISSGYVMFILGLLLSYFIIFPFTVQFLGNYQVDTDVTNMISLESYMSTLIMMSICLGTVFELPVLSWLCAKMGVLSSSFLRYYRKHSIVIILIVAAIITPTSDVFTLLLVSFPIWLLYETSILVVKRTEKSIKG